MSKKIMGHNPLEERGRFTQTLDFIGSNGSNGFTSDNETASSNTNHRVLRKKAQKKVVSYYLEVDLIRRLKMLANYQDYCYSGLVSEALWQYIENFEE